MFLGIDIGGTDIKYGLIDQDHAVLVRGKTKTHLSLGDQDRIIREMADHISRDLLKQGFSLSGIQAIGVASPGIVDDQAGEVRFAANLHFEHCPIRRLLERPFAVPIYLINDANAAALAEARMGAGRGSESSVTITLGTGVGSGVVLHNQLYTGFTGTGVEMGHMLIEIDGRPCKCGGRGCFEAYASATALMKDAQEAARIHPDSLLAQQFAQVPPSAKLVYDTKAAGCPVAAAVIATYERHLALGLSSILDVYFPEKIILGGGVSAQGEAFCRRVAALAKQNAFQRGGLSLGDIVLAELGNAAGFMGAALYSEDRLQG